MRNIGKYADNVMNVMRENAHILFCQRSIDQIPIKFTKISEKIAVIIKTT